MPRKAIAKRVRQSAAAEAPVAAEASVASAATATSGSAQNSSLGSSSIVEARKRLLPLLWLLPQLAEGPPPIQKLLR